MRAILLGTSFFVGVTSHAQDAIHTMLSQIAAMDDYIGTSEKGYQVTEEDIDSIGVITNEEYILHQAFFSSLAAVNPIMDNMPAVADINNLYGTILSQLSASLKRYQQSQWFSDEMVYIGRVYTTIRDQCDVDIFTLHQLLTADDLKMTDGERVREIEIIHKDMRDAYRFLQSFQITAEKVIVKRQKAAATSETLKKIYGN